MPVRIYEIAKKLGLDNRTVLTRAKELGIAAAKVPSSTLDKITAEFLEDKLKVDAPADGVPMPGTPDGAPPAGGDHDHGESHGDTDHAAAPHAAETPAEPATPAQENAKIPPVPPTARGFASTMAR